jgi:hypothetical protein
VSDAALAFARNELDRAAISDDALAMLAAREAREFLPYHADAAPILAQRLVRSLHDRRPLSLVRIGDGEGSALGLTGADVHPAHAASFSAQFQMQNGTPLNPAEASPFCRALRDALDAADVVGFRSVDRTIMSSERTVIENHLSAGHVNQAVGMLCAREYLVQGLHGGQFRDKTVTSAWVHLSLIRHLDDLLDAASSVSIVTGRPTLRGQFEQRVGGRLRSFVAVPVEGHRPSAESGSHYEMYPAVVEMLSRDLTGTLLLVGAGLFGKIYCDVGRTHGAVAVDFGSSFDLLAGHATRPVHRRFQAGGFRSGA